MYFTQKFEVSPASLNEYGAININLTADRPLFIDPLLIFHRSKYEKWYNSIVQYLEFLFQLSSRNVDKRERTRIIKTYFMFREICQNWLGYSLNGNKGRGQNEHFGAELFNNISYVFTNREITRSVHLEKIVFFSDNVGKDNISDFTTNLVKGHLCEFTQEFAIRNINPKYLRDFEVDKAGFDYSTETFITKNYRLPFIIIGEKIEYVILTPRDIVRQENQAINKSDMLLRGETLLESIDNDSLKTQINSYINTLVDNAIIKYREKKKTEPTSSLLEKLRKDFFKNAINHYPVLMDYYIKYKEDTANSDADIALNELLKNDAIFVVNAVKLETLFRRQNKTAVTDEAILRIVEFRRIIEKCGGYKLLYFEGKKIANENTLQRLFKFAQVNLNFAFFSEVNNGTGPADFIYTDGKNSQIVEFKLASNPKLSHLWAQTNSYEEATKNSLNTIIVVFYFDEDEYERTLEIMEKKNKTEEIEKTIFLVNCSNKKVSASQEK